jgi:hypothetical protein
VATTVLGDASALLRQKVTDVDALVADDPEYARVARTAVASSVVRYLRGIYEAHDPAARLFFTRDELASLTTAGTSETSNLPSGSFPDALSWPDPVQCY